MLPRLKPTSSIVLFGGQPGCSRFTFSTKPFPSAFLTSYASGVSNRKLAPSFSLSFGFDLPCYSAPASPGVGIKVGNVKNGERRRVRSSAAARWQRVWPLLALALTSAPLGRQEGPSFLRLAIGFILG
jgi:hypothetical protein